MEYQRNYTQIRLFCRVNATIDVLFTVLRYNLLDRYTNMNMHRFFIPLILIFFFSAGCARNVDGTWKAPLVYRIDVQQGNVVDQDMINKLRPGMDKNQVKYVMGTPLIKDPFHNNRWDYIYIMEPGKGERTQRHITLFFENEKLAYIEGDVKTVDHPIVEDINKKERSVVVPTEEYEGGILSKLTGKDETEKEISEEAETTAEPEQEIAEEPEETETTDESVVESTPAAEKITTAPQSNVDETNEESDTASQKQAIAEKEQDKNLVKRFWDRITSGKEESGIQESGKASERELRDAEVLEGVGGEL